MEKLIKKTLIFLIRIYQNTISPDHGPLKEIFPLSGCRQYPTCSEYAKILLEQESLFVGLGRSLKRIKNCH